jgi:VIT1/CCC1 family predicted Fe2+/Mn2+ transporter
LGFDVRLERRQLTDDPRGELAELSAIYERRGLAPDLARRRPSGHLRCGDTRRLALLGGLGARLGGAPKTPAIVRAILWGSTAMATTSGIGVLAGLP